MMSTEYVPNWLALQGMTLEGGYELKEIIEADVLHAVVRVRVLGDYTLQCEAHFFYLVEESDADRQLAVWTDLKGVGAGAAIREPLTCGKISLDNAPVIYTVVEAADENLADVIRTRALTADETRELMRAMAGALDQLHARGIVHGRVSPVEILAAGDEILLSTEGVSAVDAPPALSLPTRYLAAESESHNRTAAADVWCLGATLYEVLTQQEYQRSDQAAAAKLEHPFGSIAACCLESDPDLRCKPSDLPALVTLEKPKELLRAKAISESPAILPAPEVRTENVAAPDGIDEVPAATATDSTHLISEPAARASRAEVDPADTSDNKRLWLYLVAIGVLLFLVFTLMSHSRKPQVMQTEAPASKASEQRKPAERASAPVSQPEAAKSVANEKGARAASPANWRVVLYTYNRESDAKGKAQVLNSKHPALDAQTFSPSGTGAPYLVVSGGRVTREEAVRKRTEALHLGMPRDSYVQNFTR